MINESVLNKIYPNRSVLTLVDTLLKMFHGCATLFSLIKDLPSVSFHL